MKASMNVFIDVSMIVTISGGIKKDTKFWC